MIYIPYINPVLSNLWSIIDIKKKNLETEISVLQVGLNEVVPIIHTPLYVAKMEM